MLSRIAEALFWIGRYVERGGGTARILDVHLQLLLEDPWVDEEAGNNLPWVTGRHGDVVAGLRSLNAPEVVRELGLNAENPASIAHSVSAASVQNARRAREIIDGLVGDTQRNQLGACRCGCRWTRHIFFFNWVRDRSALAFGVVGIVDEQGRGVGSPCWAGDGNGADMTARPRPVSLTEAGGPSWTTLLRSCGATPGAFA